MNITRGLFISYYYSPIGFIRIYTRTPILSRAPAHTQIIQYDVTMHRFTREHTYVIKHTHIQDLSIPFQITTFGKEYEAVNTMTIYSSMIILGVSSVIFAKWWRMHFCAITVRVVSLYPLYQRIHTLIPTRVKLISESERVPLWLYAVLFWFEAPSPPVHSPLSQFNPNTCSELTSIAHANNSGFLTHP